VRAPVASAFLFACALQAGADSYQEARRLYYEGIAGDKQAGVRSRAMLERMVQSPHVNPLALAYFGSAKMLESRSTIAVWRKGKLAKEGLTALDRAVEAAPSHLEVRFVRAMTTFHLPGLFGRERQSREDFARIAAEAESAVANGALDQRLAAAALYHHGVFLDRGGAKADARRAWESAARVGPQTPAGRDAARRLE
jgi:hypothetical protein